MQYLERAQQKAHEHRLFSFVLVDSTYHVAYYLTFLDLSYGKDSLKILSYSDLLV